MLDPPYLEARRIVGRGFIRNDPWDVWVKQWWGWGWSCGLGGDWSIGGCWGYWLTENERVGSVLTLILALFCLECLLELTFFGVKRLLSVGSSYG